MLEQKATKILQNLSLNPKKDKILVAISGGMDSVALFHFLLNKGFKIFCVHLNHNLRGHESDKDEEFAKNLCRKFKVPFYSKKIDIKSYAKKNRISLEEAGRIKRYEFFEKIAQKLGIKNIALAHHADDNVETFLMRLLRGTGLKGLCGIPVQRGKIIRPFITVFRSEIEEYIKKYKLDYRIDKTNFQLHFTRNKIRNVILPKLQKYYPNIKNKILNLIKGFSSDYEKIESYISKKFKNITIFKDKTIYIPTHKIRFIHPQLMSFFVRKCMEKLKGDLENISSKHIESIIKLNKNKFINLPNGMYFFKNEKFWIFTFDKSLIQTIHKPFCYKLSIPGTINISEINSKIDVKKISKVPKRIVRKTHNKVYVDADKIYGKRLIVRNFIFGDKFVPLGMQKHKKLQDFFVDLKIPKEKRFKIPIVCDNKKIIWVAGYRISEEVKIDSSTKKVLELSIT